MVMVDEVATETTAEETPKGTVSEPSETFSWETLDQTPASESSGESSSEPSDVKLCEGCGEPIHRAPGQLGRLPKYHPNCKPQSTSKGRSSRNTSGKTKAEVEA